jgi:hypothetical protein
MRKLSVIALAVLFQFLAASSLQKKSFAAPAVSSFSRLQDSGTETVISTYRVKPGSEAEFTKVIQSHWPTLLRLGLVEPQPHVVLRGSDDGGKPIFVEVLTWKDSDAPDNAPPEVRKIWAQMELLCEPRAGHRGIEFPEFQIVPVPQN